MAAITAALLLSAASLATSTVAGVQQRKAQKTSMREQQEAQTRAQNAAMQQQRSSDQEAAARAMKHTPDVASLLAAQSKTKSPSLLSGPTGVDPSGLALGRTKLLGE